VYINLLQSNVWTEVDDRALIEVHKHHGNRWSAIARSLSRSENSVKKHRNSMKRTLRRANMKKSGQVPFSSGQLNPLEEYVVNLDETSTDSKQLGNLGFHDEVQTAFPNTIMGPMDYSQQTVGMSYIHGGMVYPNVPAPQASYNNPSEMGMYKNPTDLTVMRPVQAYAYNEPQVTDNLTSFTSQVNYPLQQGMDSQGTNINFDCPLPENVGSQSFDQGSSDVFYNDAGPRIMSDAAAPTNDFNVFQIDSMEIYSPEYDMSLDPSKYI
jgi:hypothetical protein